MVAEAVAIYTRTVVEETEMAAAATCTRTAVEEMVTVVGVTCTHTAVEEKEMEAVATYIHRADEEMETVGVVICTRKAVVGKAKEVGAICTRRAVEENSTDSHQQRPGQHCRRLLPGPTPWPMQTIRGLEAGGRPQRASCSAAAVVAGDYPANASPGLCLPLSKFGRAERRSPGGGLRNRRRVFWLWWD